MEKTLQFAFDPTEHCCCKVKMKKTLHLPRQDAVSIFSFYFALSPQDAAKQNKNLLYKNPTGQKPTGHKAKVKKILQGDRTLTPQDIKE